MTSMVQIGGETYELILTTRATKQIAERFGGLSNFGKTLMDAENMELAISETVWLITVLANQSVLIHNLKNPANKRTLLTEDMVELLTSPFELAAYKDLIVKTMQRDTKRTIESEEEEEKNTAGA